jgi:hypothetical protein
MIRTLFDNKRRDEIRGALLQGRPIQFRAREPKSDAMSKTQGEEKPLNYYDGKHFVGESLTLSGFEIKYTGAEGSGISMEISCGDGPAKKVALALGKETAVDFATEGIRIKVTPREFDFIQGQDCIKGNYRLERI